MDEDRSSVDMGSVDRAIYLPQVCRIRNTLTPIIYCTVVAMFIYYSNKIAVKFLLCSVVQCACNKIPSSLFSRKVQTVPQNWRIKKRFLLKKLNLGRKALILRVCAVIVYSTYVYCTWKLKFWSNINFTVPDVGLHPQTALLFIWKQLEVVTIFCQCQFCISFLICGLNT